MPRKVRASRRVRSPTHPEPCLRFRTRRSTHDGVKRITTFFLAAVLAACVGGKSQISAEDKERLKPYILEAVPGEAKKTDVNFENKIHLVGYKVEPENAPPGTAVKATYYWRC